VTRHSLAAIMTSPFRAMKRWSPVSIQNEAWQYRPTNYREQRKPHRRRDVIRCLPANENRTYCYTAVHPLFTLLHTRAACHRLQCRPIATRAHSDTSLSTETLLLKPTAQKNETICSCRTIPLQRSLYLLSFS